MSVAATIVARIAGADRYLLTRAVYVSGREAGCRPVRRTPDAHVLYSTLLATRAGGIRARCPSHRSCLRWTSVSIELTPLSS